MIYFHFCFITKYVLQILKRINAIFDAIKNDVYIPSTSILLSYEMNEKIYIILNGGIVLIGENGFLQSSQELEIRRVYSC